MRIEAIVEMPGDSGPSPRWLHFENPIDVRATTERGDVAAVIAGVERDAKRFDCFAVGYVCYEAGSAFGLKTNEAVNGLPLTWFALFDRRMVRDASSLFEKGSDAAYRLGALNASADRESFMVAFAQIKAHLAAGDSYQANYTFQLRGSFDGDARAFFTDLVAAQRGGHALYLDTGRHAICSASPELFFERRSIVGGGPDVQDAKTINQRVVIARPMKGTARRGRTLDEDSRLRDALVASPKQRAENVMIVDMIRNDLGRVATVGSVTVPDLFTPEKYPNVWQMTSEVRARSAADLAAIVAALHPSASVTGAPKASTMTILATLEPEPRGIYTGALGLIRPDGSAQFNVAIRTAVIDREAGQLSFGVGSGIVWDSEANAEYEECLLKGSVLDPSRLTTGARPFELLETLRWDPGVGYLLLERHLARMEASAGYFDFAYDERRVRSVLEGEIQGCAASRRVRLLLRRDGTPRVEGKDWVRGEEPVTAGLAATPVDSSEVFLFHKTTNRALYEARRRPDTGETILWNERGEVTESITANIVAEIDGRRVTPAVDCGLLPGTYRADLLARGEIEEARITIAGLQTAQRFWLINSVQEWREGHFVD